MEEQQILEFVRTAIGSVWGLELLLLLRRDAGRTWRLDELVRELRSSEAAIKGALKSLDRAGLIAETGSQNYKYDPLTPALDELAALTQRTYAIKPSTVITAIFEPPSDKLRKFAEAFKLKR